ncbi:MAG: hypothetical protein WC673_03015 [Candidatus Paceibacterota bacterium]
MNKLIPSALFSAGDAKEQKIRMVRRGKKPVGEPDDCRDQTHIWDRAAEGFRKHDPTGRKLAELLESAEKA